MMNKFYCTAYTNSDSVRNVYDNIQDAARDVRHYVFENVSKFDEEREWYLNLIDAESFYRDDLAGLGYGMVLVHAESRDDCEYAEIEKDYDEYTVEYNEETDTYTTTK